MNVSLKERDINISTVFIRDDLPDDEQEIKKFSWSFKKYIPYLYISAYRDIEREMNSKKGDMFEILQTFNPYQIMPIQTLKKKALSKIDEVSIEIERIGYSEVKHPWIELRSNVEKIDKSTKEEIDTLIKSIESIKQSTEKNINIVEKELLIKLISQSENLLDILRNRIFIQDKMGVLNEDFKKLYGMKDIEKNLNGLFSEFLANDTITLDIISSNDEDFLRQLNIGIGDYSILKHGSGYQNLLSLTLKLFKSIYYIIGREEVEYRSFLIAIEEPESHLHPHLQRHFIKALKNIQEKFSEKDISLQFIISTHSPFIITPLTFDNLTFLRSGKDISPYAIKINKKQIATEIVTIFNIAEEKKKRRKISQIYQWIDHLFYDIPEIFFGRCIIIGEGETEQGAIPIFGDKIEMNLDKYGISFLMGEGDSLVYPLKLLSCLKTSWILIVDNDKIKTLESLNLYPSDNIIPTSKEAFELEIISKSPLKKILIALDSKSLLDSNQRRISELKGYYPSMKGKDIESLEDLLKYLDPKDIEKFKKDFVLKWMKDEKGLPFGRILAELLEKDEIPTVYVDAIKKAVKNIGGISHEPETHNT
ncbi:MAG: AAA family ATPase [Candidatus Methanoperedens sp.]